MQICIDNLCNFISASLKIKLGTKPNPHPFVAKNQKQKTNKKKTKQNKKQQQQHHFGKTKERLDNAVNSSVLPVRVL